MKELIGKLLLGTAALACPCHLPILLAVLGGTALGIYLNEYLGVVFVLLLAYFLAALIVGLRLIKPRLEASHRQDA